MPREIVVQADIGGIQIAFTDPIDENDSDAYADVVLDMRMKSIGRQRARLELPEKLLAMQIREQMLADFPGQEARVFKTRAEARARMTEGWRAEFEASGRRGEFKPGPSHRKNLEDFDAETERVKAQFADKKRDLEEDGPKIEAQVSRLRAVIAGRDPTEYVGDTERLEAAE